MNQMIKLKFRAVIPERNAKIIFTLEDLIMAHLDKSLFSIREILIPWLLVGNEPDRYTSLDDKNGVEIYEDDTLRINLDGESYISPVMKKHGCWVIYHPYRLDMHTGERDYINFGWWTSHDNVEVIGNIHEQESQT